MSTSNNNITLREADKTDVLSRILVIDDDDRSLSAIRRVLEQYGFAHEGATDGLTAIDMVRTWLPDVVLLDVYMPGLDGVEVCKQIKADPALRHIPVISLTANSDREVKMRCLDAGASDFLSKPIDYPELILKVQNHVRLRKYEDLRKDHELEEQHHDKLKEVFKKVANAKEEWEKTIDCIQDMVLLIAPDGQIRRCNSPTAKFFQLTYPEIIGRNWLVLLKTRGVSIVNATDRIVEAYHEQTNRTYEIRLDPVQGEEGHGSTSVTIRDISEQKELADKIRLDEDRFEALWNLSSMQDSSVADLVDFALESAVKLTGSSGGYFHFMNEDQQSMSLYAWSRDVLKECKAAKTPHYPIALAGIWADCVRLRKPVIHNDYPNAPDRKGLPDGHFTIHRHMSIPVFEGEKVVAVAGVGNKERPYRDDDVNQLFLFMNDLWKLLKQKKQDVELREKNVQLEKAYGDLKVAKVHAFQQEKMASIGQIAAGVAHEINNPVGFIMSNLGTLQKYADKITEFTRLQSETIAGLPGADSAAIVQQRKAMKIDYIFDDLRNLVKESLDGGERIKKIVQDLKGFSRADEIEQQAADINAGIESTINIVWNELKYKATVHRNYGDLPRTVCNLGQLNQVFMNLLVNAAHAIEKSGDIRITTWAENGLIKVTIADNGCGIPADNLNRIFEPFFTTKDVGKGTGLGLSIAFEIIKKHNGDIQVASVVGKGTTFSISIPVVEAV